MLAMVKKAREERDPVRKPWWWFVLQLLSALVGGAITTGVVWELGWGMPHSLVPIAGVAGGLAVFSAVMGFLPGNYRIIETDERLTLWKPLSGKMRAAIAAGGIAFMVVGPLLAIYQASEQPAKPTRPAPRGRGRR
jgi:hypothetical protein